ncbi:MAG TPA: radical SAM protein [Verrucomicrobiae bacterium]|nr:radical SAM protein [Verrucomicrobiae bacterium]
MALALLSHVLAMVAEAKNHDELRLLFWETTAGCNLECIHCRRLDVSKQLMKDDLTTQEALVFVRALAAFAKPILVLSGGEPLFRPDIFQIATHARDHGLPVALATNGTLIDERMAHTIVDSGIRRVAISIDGADETTHDRFRRQQGSLAAALTGFRNLRRLGMSMQINCTVTKHNVYQIEDLYTMAKELGADALHLFMLVPVGCGVQIAESNMLPGDEYERVLNWMYDRSKEGALHLKATCAPHYFRVMRQRAVVEHVHADATHSHGKPEHGQAPGNGHPGSHPGGSDMAAMTKGCLAGSAICFVSHAGEVFPCGYLPVSAGNVKRQSIRDIWEHSKVFGRLRDVEQLEGKCGLCEFKKICLGCRARAFYATRGNYMAEEPHCVYEPRRMRKQQTLEDGL